MTTLKSFSLKHAAVLACFVLCSCLPGLAQSRMTVRRDVHRDVSAPLSEMDSPRPAAVTAATRGRTSPHGFLRLPDLLPESGIPSGPKSIVLLLPLSEPASKAWAQDNTDSASPVLRPIPKGPSVPRNMFSGSTLHSPSSTKPPEP